jgi:hypothetical protein
LSVRRLNKTVMSANRAKDPSLGRECAASSPPRLVRQSDKLAMMNQDGE